MALMMWYFLDWQEALSKPIVPHQLTPSYGSKLLILVVPASLSCAGAHRLMQRQIRIETITFGLTTRNFLNHLNSLVS